MAHDSHPFDVAVEPWIPAAAGFAVTVIVHIVDAQTGRPHYLPSTAAEWARTILRQPITTGAASDT